MTRLAAEFGNDGTWTPSGETTGAAEATWQASPWSTFRDESPEEHRWLINGLLPEGTLAFVAGPPKKGKTWIGLAEALAVATEKALFGAYAVPEARPVLYVALEGSRAGLRARIGALARGLGVNPDTDALDRLHVLYRPRPFDLADPALAKWLVAEARRLDAALVIVDVLRAAARINENAAEDFARVRDQLEPLLTEGRTVELLHHFGKLNETQKERSPGERMAGTGAMYGALDVGFLITRSDAGARRMRVDVEARDFAAPDALGLVIVGTGSGEHGGFTYTDSATIEIDPTAIEGRDLVTELDALFADGEWRTSTEAASKAKGIAANRDEVEVAFGQAPERFVMVTGDEAKRAGRSKTAKAWGTVAMKAALHAPKVAQGPEQPEQPSLPNLHEPQVEEVAPLTGRATEQPPQTDQQGSPPPPSNLSNLDHEEVDEDARPQVCVQCGSTDVVEGSLYCAAHGGDSTCTHETLWLARDGVHRCVVCEPPTFPSEVVARRST